MPVSGLRAQGNTRALSYALTLVETAFSPCTALTFHVDILRNPFIGECLPNFLF
jgi:hypothetical protein